MPDAVVKCWICNTNDANTGEHTIKHSHLRALFENEIKSKRFYFHSLKRTNQLVQSLDAEILKSPTRICADCNNRRTQPHDRAWELMSEWLMNRAPPIKVGDYVRGNRIFPHHTKREMRNVHLYFLKLFGCMIKQEEAKIPFPIGQFSEAIMQEKPHPEVYLRIGCGDRSVGRSDLICHRMATGHIGAHWLYRLDRFAVSVMYLQGNTRWENIHLVWHPRFGSNRFLVADFTGPKNVEDAAIPLPH